jgi:hypothetical protein
MSKRDIHVVPRDGHWAVGARARIAIPRITTARATRWTPHATRRVATASRSSSTGVTAASSDSYGRAPFPPRDRKH